MTSLANRTALVTGGGVGIGLAIARDLARHGARIAITYRTHVPSQEIIAELASLSGQEPIIVALDATDPEQVKEFTDQLSAKFGSLDILVNNIGGLIERSTIEQMSFELWRRVMATNLDSTFLITNAMLPIMTHNGGRIINIASLAGRSGGHPGATAYATSKAAIFGFTRGLSKEVAPDGITVNALAPGFIEATPFHSTFTTEESKRNTITQIPVGRAGVPEDCASAVTWLAGPETSFVTGTIIDINGGQYFG